MAQAMSPRLERLYLAAVQSGWWMDWQRYYAAEECERQARLLVLERESQHRSALTPGLLAEYQMAERICGSCGHRPAECSCSCCWPGEGR